ncbi:MAG: septum site-determining protein MinC [Armatimonas sp.]
MPQVEIKGWRNGLLIVVPPESPWDSLTTTLAARLDEANARSFWKGSQAVLDFGSRIVTQDRLTELVDRLKEEYGLVPTAVVSTEEVTRRVADKLVLTTYETLPAIQKPGQSAEVSRAPLVEAVGNNARYVVQTVRSGQRIEHDGHLAIIGDVNPGGEVLAAGDIVIFGNLRGLAHAGCYGDETARIVALALKPPQLRIATKIARAPDTEKGNRELRPEVARIEDGEIQVFPL